MKKYSDEMIQTAVEIATSNLKRYEDICRDYREWEKTCTLEYAEWCQMVDSNYVIELKNKAESLVKDVQFNLEEKLND